jgi:putative zinc finger/helix-turn-helix YgiT family protein
MNDPCVMCGAPMGDPVGETVAYDCGLPNVAVAGAVVSRCPSCGEQEVQIPNVAGLHEALALALVSRPGPLSVEEIRFLRKYLGWSGRDFARHFEVADATVSRWENGKRNMPAQSQTLLRRFVRHGPVERDDEPVGGVKRSLRFEHDQRSGGWKWEEAGV